MFGDPVNRVTPQERDRSQNLGKNWVLMLADGVNKLQLQRELGRKPHCR